MITTTDSREYTTLSTSNDLDPLMDKVGKSKFVLLGEATHGSHEYFTWRTEISKRLIMEKGFSFIAVEGDWSDCYRINRYVKGYEGAGNSAVEVLEKFRRWPSWMWANQEIASLMEWLKEFNHGKPAHKQIGFYGLDAYGLWESMETIVEYLKNDPSFTKSTTNGFVHDRNQNDGHDQARTLLSLSSSSREEVVKLLRTVRERSQNHNSDPEEALNKEMNSQVIDNADEYYRMMISFRDQLWNIRDSRMMETLDAVMNFHGENARGIIWEHKTVIGDARSLEAREDGNWNLGQLVRTRYDKKNGVFVVGFSSYAGSVISGRSWGGPMEVMMVPRAMIRSTGENAVRRDSPENRLVMLDSAYWKTRFADCAGRKLIGVVYHPECERGNYVSALLPSQYDALIYIGRTSALHPLHLKSEVRKPGTYPFGFQTGIPSNVFISRTEVYQSA